MIAPTQPDPVARHEAAAIRARDEQDRARAASLRGWASVL